MKSTVLTETDDSKVWLLVLAAGEKVKQTLEDFAKREKISSASFIALGAFEKAMIGYFQWDKKQYKQIPIDEQVEVITLAGDIVRDEKGKPSLHAHVVLGRSDGSTRSGHLLEATVRPTLEITLTQSPARLMRRKHPELGIALIEPV